MCILMQILKFSNFNKIVYAGERTIYRYDIRFIRWRNEIYVGSISSLKLPNFFIEPRKLYFLLSTDDRYALLLREAWEWNPFVRICNEVYFPKQF
jgi:hypothetical protein